MVQDPAIQEMIFDDLKGIITGKILIDALSIKLYSCDASPFEVTPLAVVIPNNQEEVSALVKYAFEKKIPLIPRGSGTGTSGAALGNGIVIDLSQNFKNIISLEDGILHAECGVTIKQLSDFITHTQFRIPSAPWNEERSLGGWLSSDAAGPFLLADKHPRHYVTALKVVLDDGSISWIESPTLGSEPAKEKVSRMEILQEGFSFILEEQKEELLASFSTLPFPHGNYNLSEIIKSNNKDMHQVFLGAEGTLGIIIAAKIRVIEKHQSPQWGLYCFSTLQECLEASHYALQHSPDLCDILEHRFFSLAKANDNLCAEWIHPDTNAVLLVCFSGVNQNTSLAAFEKSISATGVIPIRTYQCLDALTPNPWRLREVALKALARVKGPETFLQFIDDLVLPRENLGQFLEQLTTVLKDHESTAIYAICPGTGQVQLRVLGTPQKRKESARLWSLADKVYGLVQDFGGALSCQEALGLSRLPWQTKISAGVLPSLRKIKDLFDPYNQFNPGKVVGTSSEIPIWPFRSLGDLENQSESNIDSVITLQPILKWKENSPLIESSHCNGCGLCRTQSSAKRMCPTNRVIKNEHATPRAKANLARMLLGSPKEQQLFSSEEMRDISDLCINCRMCAIECPSHVDIPGLMLEAKVANVEMHSIERSDWVLSRTELFSSLGSMLAPLSNLIMGNIFSRWLIEKLFGISRLRKIPPFTRSNFIKRAKKKGWTKKPSPAKPKVAYFVDIFANYHDPSIGEAIVAILHHNGIEVHVPEGQVGCGMAPLAQGDIDYARAALRQNVRIFADLAREGYPIICSEPTAALFFKQDAGRLLEDPDVDLVASKVEEFTSFLWNLHMQGLLKTDFAPVDLRVGQHVPCHLKALGQPLVTSQLLGLIPQLHLEALNDSCSGMAGTFGLKAANLSLSKSIGQPMLSHLEQSNLVLGTTECSACRIQMEDVGTKQTLHPAQLLALAYGLMPGLSKMVPKLAEKRLP